MARGGKVDGDPCLAREAGKPISRATLFRYWATTAVVAGIDHIDGRGRQRFAHLRRMGQDSNLRTAFAATRFPGVRLKPLGHPS